MRTMPKRGGSRCSFPELARTLAAPPVLATHDTQLALAASACGLPVLGV